MSNTERKKDAQSRIIYVEPNDTSGHVNGIPITPDYTDFCISFDLIVDVVSRMRANSVTISQPETVKTDDGEEKQEMKTYVISWTSKYDPEGKNANTNPNQVSFMGGVRYGTRGYLTTFYTDTHYNNFKNKTIVEGLGVESVSISFESYYAPTVKIRFIDVRGASIFGREEVLHTDEVLAEDNIWGCFFTFPYPKYRLQVKGFYGKAVTYQLCCTDFRANFNSNTGNYEIDMSFLGYDFGLLADIPMQYLIAAPYCHYANTMAHWTKESASNPYWKMSDGREPDTFFNIRRKIAAAIETLSDDKSADVTEEEYEETVVNSDKVSALEQIKKYVDRFMLYAEALVRDFSQKVKEQYNVESELTQTERAYPGIPNGLVYHEDRKKYGGITVDSGLKKHRIEDVDEGKKLIDEYKSKFSSGFDGLTDTFWKNFRDNYFQLLSAERLENGILVPVMQIIKEYERAINDTSEVVAKTRQITSSQITGKKQIQEIVGFLPNIGNVFKTLYCHLETFVHMIYICASNIYAQKQAKERDYQKLGIKTINLTDVNPKYIADNQMDPFPAVYMFKNTNEDNKDSEQDDVDDKVQIDAWPGEIRRNNQNVVVWEEEVLVNELFKAVLHTKMDESDSSITFSSTQFPVLPSDLNHNTIAGVGLTIDAPTLAGYLAIRAASLFGISEYTKNEAEEVGKAEAFNYFESVASKATIKNKIFDSLGNGNKADELYNLMLCQGDYGSKNKLPFEVGENLARVKDKRHPFFVINGSNNLQWCYAEDSGSNAFVPSRLATWNSLNTEILEYHGASKNSYYTFKSVNGNSNILYKRFTDPKLSEEAAFTEDDKKLYTNNEMFTVYYGGNYGNGQVVAEKVTKLYDNMKDGAVSLNGYTKESDPNRFKKLLENHWRNVDENSFDETYHSNLQSLYPSLSILGVDKTKVGVQDGGNILFIGGDWYGDTIANKNVVERNGEFKYGDKTVSYDECYCLIPELRFYYSGGSNVINVFTSRCYYLQNDFNKVYGNDKSFDFSSREFASEAVKAFFFLLTLDHYSDTKPSYLKNINAGKIEGVPLSIILFHGAIIWRREFFKINGFDPIISNGFRSMSNEDVPIIKENNQYIRAILLDDVQKDSRVYVKYSEIFGSSEMDILLKNKLIDMFKHFVNNEWKTIKENCELLNSDGTPLSASDIEDLAIVKDISDKDFITKLRRKLGRHYIGKYFYINRFVESLGLRMGLCSVLAEENPVMPIIKEMYLSKIIIQKTASNLSSTNGGIAIEPSVMKSFLNGFVKQLEEICNSETVNTLSTTSSGTDEQEGDRDIKRLIYMFLKNMWDRWFVGNSEDMFTVKNYMANTIFIDSMYRNVYTHLHINCEILHDLLNENDGKAMAFKFLSDITTKHHCMFFALPDYLNLGEPDSKTAEENMLTLFNPIPYTKIDKVRSFNRYIVMFTHKPSEVNENSNSYKYDSFDIYSHDEDKKSILPTFEKPAVSNTSVEDYEMQCTRYGYNVPAFGIEFGRQNNAIFKKINVGMQNPVQTEQAINALSLIANRGRGAGERTIFYGQDLYSVYSGYSYTATIEMMGNAQIMPLMYFQLFNVPMFRGAYMIYSVQHTMKPGDMTTTVKAMKMSKHTLPWCQEWYAHYYFDAEGNITTDYDDNCGTGGGAGGANFGPDQKLTKSEITSAHDQSQLSQSVGKSKYHKLSPEMKAYVDENVVKVLLKMKSTGGGDLNKWVVINKNLASDIKAIFDDIYKTDYKFNPGQFATYGGRGEKPLVDVPNAPGESGSVSGSPTVLGCYQYRNTKKGSVSNHAFAAAVDLNPGYNPWLNHMDGNKDDDLHIRTKHHPVVQAFAKHGWGWGGSYGDMMHFSPFYGS